MPSPVRTCVGCRGRAAKTELLRIVWQAGPVVDPQQRETGRGAYLHRRPECLELALKRRSLARALRLPPGGQLDGASLRRVVEPHLDPADDRLRVIG
ncbi:MAG TPA: YlxR family protein [Microlunatus sp.]|nr:YlxR family protein [Microlunatus sp.]